MKAAAPNSASKTPTKPRVPKAAGDSPVRKGATTENCDPNVAAKRATPVKVFRARSAASPKKDLEQVLAAASEEHHACSPVKEGGGEERGPAGAAGDFLDSACKPDNLKCGKGSEHGLTPSAGDHHHHASCAALAKSVQSGGSVGGPSPARKHICKSARCAANDPDYAVPAPTPPRKFLLSKRHILQQQLEESLKRYKKCFPDAGGAGNVDGVENSCMQEEQAPTGDVSQKESQPDEEVRDEENNVVSEETEGAESVGVQAVDSGNPVSTGEAADSGGMEAGEPLAHRDMEASERGAPDGMEEAGPVESKQALEAVATEDVQTAEPFASQGMEVVDTVPGTVGIEILEASEPVVFQGKEDVETAVPESTQVAEAVVQGGGTEAADEMEGMEGAATPVIGGVEASEPVAALDMEKAAPAVSKFMEVGEEVVMEFVEGADSAVPEGLQSGFQPGMEAAGLVDDLQSGEGAEETMEEAEPSEELLSRSGSKPATDLEAGEAESSGDEEWVFLDPLTAPLDNDIGETLVTDVSGRPSLVGNYLTARVWGKRKSAATCPINDREVVNVMRAQVPSCRKSSSEWKLDNAMKEALAGTDPYGEGRVRTLVQAFEKVISLTECDQVLPRHAYRKFSFHPRQKEVAVTGPQLDSEPAQPADVSVEWVKVDVMTAGDQEDMEADTIRDSVASLTSSYSDGSECTNDIENQGQAEDLKALHRNFAGVDLWKHFIFSATAADVVEGSQNGSDEETRNKTSSRGAEDCNVEGGNLEEHADDQAPQLGHGGAGYAEGPSEVGECEYATECSTLADGATHPGVPESGTGCTGEAECPAGDYQYDHAHGSECEDCRYATADGDQAYLDEAEYYFVQTEGHEGDKRLVSEVEAGICGRDSSCDNASGQACHTGRGAAPRRVIPTTELHPFKLHTEERGAMHDMAFARKMEQIFAEEARLRIPIARGLPWTTDEPEVVPKPPVKEQTKPVEFRLLSTARAMDRAEFDRYVLESQQYYENQRQEEQRLRQMVEEEEVRRLRHQMVPRAQLMPYFDQPFQPRRSGKRLTVPKEPNFHCPNKRSKCPGTRWKLTAFIQP